MITELKIRYYGDPCLRKKSVSLKEVGPSERILIKAMVQSMYKEDGVGLAAPQIGINYRIIVGDAGEGPFVVINPVILNQEGSEKMEEGCLSVPGITVSVSRP